MIGGGPGQAGGVCRACVWTGEAGGWVCRACATPRPGAQAGRSQPTAPVPERPGWQEQGSKAESSLLLLYKEQACTVRAGQVATATGPPPCGMLRMHQPPAKVCCWQPCRATHTCRFSCCHLCRGWEAIELVHEQGGQRTRIGGRSACRLRAAQPVPAAEEPSPLADRSPCSVRAAVLGLSGRWGKRSVLEDIGLQVRPAAIRAAGPAELAIHGPTRTCCAQLQAAEQRQRDKRYAGFHFREPAAAVGSLTVDTNAIGEWCGPAEGLLFSPGCQTGPSGPGSMKWRAAQAQARLELWENSLHAYSPVRLMHLVVATHGKGMSGRARGGDELPGLCTAPSCRRHRQLARKAVLPVTPVCGNVLLPSIPTSSCSLAGTSHKPLEASKRAGCFLMAVRLSPHSARLASRRNGLYWNRQVGCVGEHAPSGLGTGPIVLGSVPGLGLFTKGHICWAGMLL